MSETTPRPWRIVWEGEAYPRTRDPHRVWYIVGPDGDCGRAIVETDSGVYGPSPDDAMLIVTAVNHHEALVEFVRRFWALRTAEIRGESPPETFDDLARNARDLLKAEAEALLNEAKTEVKRRKG